MANNIEGDNRGFVEKMGWSMTRIGLILIALGLFGGFNNLAAAGLGATTGGVIAENFNSQGSK